MMAQQPDLLSRIKAWAGEILGRPGPAGLIDWTGRRAGWAVLALGLVVFILAQGYVTIYPLTQKEVPTEADDAFAYITKAVQMKECFFQDCPALKDLLAQASDREADVDPFLKYQVFSKTILIYHPLHSVVLVGLNGLGMSWEAAYNAVWVAGFVLLTAGTALLLIVLFGPGGAGFALILLPFFRNEGFDFMIPTNMATALSMALWAAVLAKVRFRPWLVSIGAAILLPLHMIGILYVMVLLALYWVSATNLKDRGRIVATLICLGLAGIHLALPLVFSKPLFSVGSFADSWYGPLALFPENLRTVVTTLTRFIEGHGGYVICGLLLGIGAVFNDKVRQHRVVLIFWLCLGLVAASFLPRAPVGSNAFHRIQAPLLVLLCGLMGRAGWVWLREAGAWLRQALTGWEPKDRKSPFPGATGWRLAGLVLVGVVLIRVVLFGAMEFRASAGPVVEHNISRKDYRFDPAQVELLEAVAKPGDRVYYRNLEPMQYYLNHGALKYGAVLSFLLSKDKAERQAWLASHPPNFVVSGNPVWGISRGRPRTDRPIYQWGGIFLPSGTGLDISLDEPAPLGGLELLVEWPKGRGRVVLTSDQDQVHELTEAPGEPGRLVPAKTGGNSLSGFKLKGNEPFRLLGVRLDPAQKTRWPWNRGVVFKAIPSGSGVPVKQIRFETARLNPLSQGRLEVLDDKGSSVLLRVVR